jgi:hypothetical protein
MAAKAETTRRAVNVPTKDPTTVAANTFKLVYNN